jgi:Mor family transcriptional regulator
VVKIRRAICRRAADRSHTRPRTQRPAIAGRCIETNMGEQQDLIHDDDTDDLAADILSADAEDMPRGRWPRQLAEFVDVTVRALRREGIGDEEAVRLAEVVVLQQALYVGGDRIYWPKGDALATALTHSRIFHEHRRDNVPDLARQYGLSTRQIQRIYRQQLRIRRGRRQIPLFGEKDA